jgi:DnaK suppressor protein
MRKQDLEQFQRQLESQRRNLLHSVRHFDEDAKALQPDYPQDTLDRCLVDSSKELLLILSNEQRGRLRVIDRALQRIDAGTFGICAACGDEISSKRLEVVPWTEFCVKCHEKQERGEPVYELG